MTGSRWCFSERALLGDLPDASKLNFFLNAWRAVPPGGRRLPAQGRGQRLQRALGTAPGNGIDCRGQECERLAGLLNELIRLDVDVLTTAGMRPAVLAKDATKTLPVVAVAVDDPVKMGLVARP